MSDAGDSVDADRVAIITPPAWLSASPLFARPRIDDVAYFSSGQGAGL
jgi:hypothetical protein